MIQTMYIKKVILLCSFLLMLLIGSSQTKRMTRLEYITKYKDDALIEMKEFKVPASITLSQALIEASDGNSKLAKLANNHFGIKCHKDWKGETFFMDDDTINECFRKYPTVLDSYKDHSNYLTSKKRYAFLFQLPIQDYKAWARGLRSAGYATNPKYAELLIGIIEDNKLYLYDRDSAMLLVTNNRKPTKHFWNTKRALINDDFEVSIGRNISLTNDVPYIIARNGDSFTKIAQDFDLMLWQLYRYNDLDKTAQIKEGEKIYIKPKRRKSRDTEIYTAKQGETMYAISQRFGIKLKKLYKKNRMNPGQEPVSGQIIQLQKKI